ncbi:MAG: methyltransferase family protein [Bacteroidota bacterium]
MPLQEEMETQGNFLFKYRSILPLIILIPGLVLFSYNEYLETYRQPWYFEDQFQLLCLLVCLFGFLIRIYTVGFVPKNTSGRNTTEGQVADQLNTTGIYSTVRHPLYVGNFFMWLGFAMLTEHFWFVVAFIFIYWVYYERIMFAEEQYLRKKFGETYLAWASHTPAFIPGFSRFRKNVNSFSIRKVFKREKAGLLNIFLLFFVFQYIENYIEHKILIPTLDFWSVALLLSLVFYIIIKLLQSQTSLFAEPVGGNQ